MYGGMVVLYTMAALVRPWQRRLMLTGWIVGVVVTMQHQADKEPFEYAFHLMGLVCAYALGVLIRVQRAYTTELEDRAGRLERERAADHRAGPRGATRPSAASPRATRAAGGPGEHRRRDGRPRRPPAFTSGRPSDFVNVGRFAFGH